MKKENELEVLGGGCASNTCPTIYRDASGKIFVQGYRMDAQTKEQVNIGENEDVVELAEDLLDVLKKLN